MPYDPINKIWTLTDRLAHLQVEKKAAIEVQKRKYQDWDDNQELYRNKVKTNRLTQRQAVNIPLMKETVKTLLSRIDNPSILEWKELGGSLLKQLNYQEIWNEMGRRNKLEIIDVLDKKNVLLYGLSTKKLNIGKNGVDVSVLDIYDILLDPMMNAWDLETSRFIIHQNIFRPVRDILADPRYTEAGKNDLKIWADSAPGLTQGEVNREQFEHKMERLRAMGLSSDKFAYFAGGDRLVNLTEHYTKIWDEKHERFERRVIVYADDCIELLNEKLVDLIGVDFWPFVTWSEDPETNDIYPDSIADLVRTPNKVLNIWFSQLIENRTLKNFQMHWFLPMSNYSAQTYTPGPGVMLPAPPGDDINKVIKPVEVSGLDDTLQAINAVTQIVERGSGATAIEKGQPESGTQTLGEVQILVGKANERAVGMAKFYRLAWEELAWKWDKMMQANPPKVFTLWKVGRSGKIYEKTLAPSDWKSDKGYVGIVRSTSEQETESVKGIQKFQLLLKEFPENPALKRIAQKRMLEFADVTPDELKQVEDAERQVEEEKRRLALAQTLPPQGVPQATPELIAPPTAPPAADTGSEMAIPLAEKLAELNQLTA